MNSRTLRKIAAVLLLACVSFLAVEPFYCCPDDHQGDDCCVCCCVGHDPQIARLPVEAVPLGGTLVFSLFSDHRLPSSRSIEPPVRPPATV
jgi:hypothetical protein